MAVGRFSINPSAKSHPAWDAIVGAFFLGGQICATSYTVMTDESLLGFQVPFGWDIVLQPGHCPGLFTVSFRRNTTAA